MSAREEVARSRAPLVAPRTRLGRVLAAIGRAAHRVPRAAALVLALAWMSAIWSVSSLSQPGTGTYEPLMAVLHNFVHAPEFGLLTLFVALVLPRRDGWVSTEPRVLAVAWCAATLYAIADELHQSRVPHRDASALDVVTDAVAATIVVLALRFLAGPAADERKLARVVVLGLAACIACAALATFVPQAFPSVGWL